MGSITESFSNLNEVLIADYNARRGTARDIFASRFVKPLLPAAIRVGTGQIVDVKDRVLGPFDIIGCWEAFPPLGEGAAGQFLVDGVAFCLQVRNWKEEDLTQFAQTALKLRALARKTKPPIFSAIVSFESMPEPHVAEFLKSSAGQALDGVLAVGQHLMLRNTHGWYGDPKRVPFVTGKGEGEALKSFAFWILQITHQLLGTPYQLADYQHL